MVNRLMNNIVIGVGIVLIAVGVLSPFISFTATEKKESAFGLYEEEETKVTSPYRSYAMPLFGAGILVVVVGSLVGKNSD